MSTRTIRTTILAVMAFLAVFGMLFTFALPTEALAWDDCPRGEVDCVYPGDCSRYIDTNGDNICDLSQPDPALTAATTSPPTTTAAHEETSPTATTTVTDETPAEESSTVSTSEEKGGRRRGSGTVVAATGSATTTTTLPASGAVSDTAADSESAAPPAAATVTLEGDADEPSFLTHYLVSPIALGFFLIYGVSFFLYKTKRIRIATHRKIWNVLLLGTFLVTGIFGVILTIQLDYELPFTIPVDLLFWHVEAGIAMTLISLFHTGWHFNYYRNLLRKSRSKARAAERAERTAKTRETGRDRQLEGGTPVPRPYAEWET